MKVEYINSFYKAIQDIFKLMLDLDVERGELQVADEMISGKDANVMLGVTGDLKGTVFFSFTKDMTLEMVKIMSGMDMDEIDKFVSSAIGEVVNIVGGNALIDLNSYSCTCDITPPQIILGEYKSISMSDNKAILIPLKTSIGEFDVNIFLAE
ncbi:CheC-like family protein [Gottschalkia acidurici 9a]|uniref:CheC-like family protein n=1 Tax=Gottschalkia acidurici (strain ATCC 7906 / DSM 604 / BCRC 14475 / CIP 104303 / KCTC 5404 / NCIMB 10678 / 9a) TaxID=1128398 RepID=K0B4R3_GOTA9|nr:chemotaxis protein CheX [Gottschalkia acidurici]AFS79566.1 CheC-like family protein [Gottschalkia acidurici 9a]